MPHIRVNKRTVIIIAGVVVVAIAFVMMVAPLLDQVRAVKLEVSTLEQELASVRKALKLRDPARRTGDLLTRQKVSLAIDEIMRTGGVRHINFLSISPQKITKAQDSRYPVLPIRMTLQSEYEDLGLFLYSLEGLKRSIVTVEGFEVEADQQDPPKVRTRLTIEIYLQEGEDE